MSKFWNKFFLGVALVLATATVALAQPKDNSPYSRLGIGDFTDQFFSAQSGLGGLSAAYHDSYQMNIANPASYSRLKSAAFELGLFSQYSRLGDASGANEDVTTWNGNLRYLSLGFPLKNPINEVLDQKKKKYRWGMNFTLLPYSNVNYNVQSQTDQTFGDTLTSVDYSFEGRGGTYKVMWGNSVNYKNFSAGINLGYFFGKIENDKFVNFADLPNAYNNSFTDDFSVGGVTWSIGVQYDVVLKSKPESGEPLEFITIGAYGNSRNKYNLTRDRLWTTRNFGYNSIPDTIFSVTGSETIESTNYLPGEFGLGVMYVKKNKSKIGVDFKLQSWKEFSNDLINATDTDKPNVTTFKVAVGGEYLPNVVSYNNYLKKVRYRYGAFYSSDPRSVQGENLSKYGVTVGMGMPIILPRQGKSFMNVALEVGQEGLADALRRTYFKLNVGFTLNDDTWFFKRKFN